VGESAAGRWLAREAHELRTLDPFDDDLSDLEPLLDVVGDARVVLLGESMHRIREFHLLRHRVLRLLAQHGFTGVVLESGLPESRLVDDWIAGRGQEPVRQVLERGITYHHGKCDEALDLVAWLRETAMAGHPVHFYGMDVPDSASSVLPGVVLLADALDVVDPAYAARVRRTLLPLMGYLPADRSGLAQAASALHAYLALPAAHRFELTARVAELAERVRSRAQDYLDAGAAPDDVSVWVQVAHNVRTADAFIATMPARAEDGFPPGNVRDLAMADTVDWVLGREERVLVCAANGHVQRTPFLAPPIVPQPMTTVGRELTARHGAEVVVVGTTYGGGSAWLHRPSATDKPGESTAYVEELSAPDPASLDALLGTRPGTFLVDLRTADGDAATALDAVRGTQNGPELVRADVRRAFDAVAHLDTISPWRTWIPTVTRPA
jgi:erythromycin esterase